MLCERCGKNQASTFVKQVINGKVQEMHLCSECAGELGFGMMTEFNPFDGMGLSISNFLGGLFSQNIPQQAVSASKTCSVCGSSFEDFMRDARAGCANCYKEFYDQLLPSIQRIHGRTRHVGKIPASASKSLKLRRDLELLRQQLNEAVEAQEYEKAATLRDKIREIEGQVQG